MQLVRIARPLILLLALAACSRQPQGEIADTVYTNGRIYTVNEAQPWAEAVAIKDGRFLVVGSNEDVGAVTGESTEVVDLEGAFAMPGMGDPHLHFGLLMPKRAFCALPGTFYEPSEPMILDALDQCTADYPADREWFIAQGYSTPAMSSETLTREVLDRLIPDRPAWIEDETGHNAWFNTLAMEAAGVDRSFEDTAEEFFSRTPDGDLCSRIIQLALAEGLVLPPVKGRVVYENVWAEYLPGEPVLRGIDITAEAGKTIAIGERELMVKRPESRDMCAI